MLRHAKERGFVTKSSLMLGLGETEDEVTAVMRDLRGVGCDIVTLGQYLQPTRNHLPVERYWHPDEFAELEARRRRTRLPPRGERSAGAQLLSRGAGGGEDRLIVAREMLVDKGPDNGIARDWEFGTVGRGSEQTWRRTCAASIIFAPPKARMRSDAHAEEAARVRQALINTRRPPGSPSAARPEPGS